MTTETLSNIKLIQNGLQ